MSANWKNRSLFYGKDCDNIHVMRGMNSNSVDLIATDPPFNSIRMFNAMAKNFDGRRVKHDFKDRWRWDDIAREREDVLAADIPSLSSLLDATRLIEGRVKNSIAAFLCWMAPRLIEMKRILKPTGSLYLHCDSSANAYLRLLMDAIFGRSAFRREIVWAMPRPSGFKTQARNWVRGHDTIFYYAGKDCVFNKQYEPYEPEYLAKFNRQDEEGRYWLRQGKKRRIGKGYTLHSVWSDIPSMQTQSVSAREGTGWATQKPVALYERIIKASSNPGDVVFDPFCGCGTTIIAAEKADRDWVGCDKSEHAAGVIQGRWPSRLQDRDGKPDDMRMINEKTHPPVRSDIEQISKKKLRSMLYLQQGKQCANRYCDSKELREVDIALDHRIPHSRGGTDAPENRIGLCQNCNGRKSDTKSWGQFLREEMIRVEAWKD